MNEKQGKSPLAYAYNMRHTWWTGIRFTLIDLWVHITDDAHDHMLMSCPCSDVVQRSHFIRSNFIHLLLLFILMYVFVVLENMNYKFSHNRIYTLIIPEH